MIQEELEKIKQWKGVETQYWVAVDILDKANQLSIAENDRLARGLDCYTGDLVNYKLRKYKEFLLKGIQEQEQTVEIVENELKDTEIVYPDKIKNRIKNRPARKRKPRQ